MMYRGIARASRPVLTATKFKQSAPAVQATRALSFILDSPAPPIDPSEYVDHNIADFIMDGFKKHADDTAIVQGVPGGSDVLTLTYAQIEDDVNSISHGLIKEVGFKSDEVAMILSPNDVDYGTVVMSVLKIGGVVSPANPLYSDKEIANQLRDSGASVLIIHKGMLEKSVEAIGMVEQPVKLMVLGDGDDATAAAGCIPLNSLKGSGIVVESVKKSGDDLAVLPYSSGTTGLPKGTMLSHANIVSNLIQMNHIETRFWNEKEVIMSPLPFFHIYGFTISLFHTLLHGSTVVTMPAFDPGQFLSLVQTYKCTRGHLVPPIIIFLAKHPVVDQFDISSMTNIISAAAPLGKETQAEAMARFPGLKIKQAWGMSELSPLGTCVPDDYENVLSGSSGVPAASMQYKIVDTENGQTLDQGKEGEILCRGPNVMLGYLNNKEATDGCLDSDGWLSTGDIGYISDDGHVFLTDRLKELIKFKGFQVPPAELEALLLTHPAVGDCAVIPRADDNAGEVPRAFVVLKPEAEATADEIAAFVEESVAPHKKLRGGVIFIDQIPKSASGKILRRMLVARDKEGEFGDHEPERK